MNQNVTKSTPLRVAMVTGGLKLGGSTTFLCNLGGELQRRRIPAEVWSFERENPLASDFERRRIPVLLQDDRKLIFEDRLAVILRRARHFQPAAILACLSSISFEVLRYMPAGVFRIGMVQSDDPRVYRMAGTYAAQLDAMAGVSLKIQRTLQAMPEFARVPIHYLPYGVPMPAAVMRTEPDSASPLRILYLGRLEQEQKRVRLFPKIFDQLKSSGIPFHWTIAGEGSEKVFLQSAMISGPQQTVAFPGQVPYHEVSSVLRAHDVFLLCSDYEGLPLSLLEAMGYGLVPVVSDLSSGIREVVDETTGKLIRPDDLQGYAGAVVWLHEHRAEMSLLAQNACARVRSQFSVEAMTDRWLKALPGNPKPGVVWPQRWSIKPMVSARGDLRFSRFGRVFRRALFRVRALASGQQ